MFKKMLKILITILLIASCSPSSGATNNNSSIRIDESLFVGNIFQIIAYDLGNIPIGTGTGYVFNSSGWFITNFHVVEDAYFFEAIFNIRDDVEGESFTTLDINNASFKNSSKDILIGTISNYYKVSSYYRDFKISTEYEVGDLTYSVGYPNSSVEMEINSGNILRDVTSIYDKVTSGIKYIGSSSYIAPGSSGGILINKNAEIIGITTIGISDSYGSFKIGGSIEAFNFINDIENYNQVSLNDIAVFLHPDDEKFIRLIKRLKNDEQNKRARKEQYNDFTRYIIESKTEGKNDSGDDYSYIKTTEIDSDGYINYFESIYWAGGSRREQSLKGYYSNLMGIDNLTYNYKYTYDDKSYYALESKKINYSENLKLTLNDYTTTKSTNYWKISESNIEYAKEHFNYVYEYLNRLINNKN
jgi:hypothetical protein